jgi:hypothetical protein
MLEVGTLDQNYTALTFIWTENMAKKTAMKNLLK